MNNKKMEAVYHLVLKSKQNHDHSRDYEGITTVEVAQALGIYRNEASTLLNKLVNEKRIRKSNTRPVYYYPLTAKESISNKPASAAILDDIIGASDSLKYQIEMAKSAILYPPLGLHTLITGESGTGKSMLAEKMWMYSCQTHDNNQIPFVTFSCAEYADNPQLILEQLFGHKKGSFTGASFDKPGLIEKANGGILFLDEIHRLPPTGQELLFILMDKGTIRRIGDTEDIHIALQIIGATSEDIDVSLLKTFRRRMPILIKMPPLSERSQREHLELIKFFLQQESTSIHKIIHITGKALQSFINYNGEGNIGDLKSCLLTSCAHAFMRDQSDKIIITVYDIPQLVYISNVELDEKYSPSIKAEIKTGITFYPNQHVPYTKAVSHEGFDLYDYSENYIPDGTHAPNQKGTDIQSAFSNKIESYYEQSVHYLKNTYPHKEDIPTVVIQATEYIIENAYVKRNRQYDTGIQSAIMLHLKQFYYLIRSGKVIYNPELEKISTYYTQEMEIVKKLLPELQRIFGVDILDDEIGFLSILLSKTVSEKKAKSRKILIVSFGKNMADSIVDYVSDALQSSDFDKLNIPFSFAPKDIKDMVEKKINSMHEAKEILVLTDIYSLSRSFADIQGNVSKPCYILPVLSSMLALEAGRFINSENVTIPYLIKNIKETYLHYLDTIFTNQPDREVESCKYILIFSTIGAENAQIIQKILLDKIAIASTYCFTICTSKEEVEQFLFNNKAASRIIIGNCDPKIEGIPFCGYENLLYEEGIEKLSMLLQYNDILFNQSAIFNHQNLDRAHIDSVIMTKISSFAPKFDSQELFDHCKNIIHQMEIEVFHTTLSVERYTRGFLHLVGMLEKLKDADPVPGHSALQLFPDQTIYRILQNEITAYHIEIPDFEIKLFYEAF